MPSENKNSGGYGCWLSYAVNASNPAAQAYRPFFEHIVLRNLDAFRRPVTEELFRFCGELFGMKPELCVDPEEPAASMKAGRPHLLIEAGKSEENPGGFAVRLENGGVAVRGADESGALYGMFALLRAVCTGVPPERAQTEQSPRNPLRIIEHWDNMSGEIERGYAGASIFFKDDKIVGDLSRIDDYARLLASVGINAVCINNTNVHRVETGLIGSEVLPDVARVAAVFRRWGVRLYLSVNFASPISLGGLATADPLDENVAAWWSGTAKRVYDAIPDFGGFIVKADSEGRPGPFTYGRDHADGANMLARALKPYGGILIWRCFVYNCHLDWRDRSIDRARAAYDNFKPLDGRFDENVVLQVKNGPMDFQIREAVSPMLGGMEKTSELAEFQITQEYTGQQKHACYLIPMWKEVLDFDTKKKGDGSFVRRVMDGSLYGRKLGGMVGISNLGNDRNWTGHPLAQANFYGFGRLAWNPELGAEEIAREWAAMTFGGDGKVLDTVIPILMQSRKTYENYTSPLGVGWMVVPHYHYGPDIDGYEYSPWGTYHYADRNGLGVDRTVKSGTGYTAQYAPEVGQFYENTDTCPDELLLFFHHVPYAYRLHSGKTVIQHIYDTHFEGVEQADAFLAAWRTLKERIDPEVFEEGLRRFEIQAAHSREWRDVVNTYFLRKSGIADGGNRKIYE